MPGLSFIVLLLSICEIDLYEATTAAGDDMKLRIINQMPEQDKSMFLKMMEKR